MISDFFIARPVLANVLAILMIVIGGVAMFALPVAQYPDVVPPTVQVTTRYPGASARTLVDTVALPIEQQVNGVEGMIYMQSYSGADGSYSLTVTFKIGADLLEDRPTFARAMKAELAKYPADLLDQAIIRVRRDPKFPFLPAIGEMVAICDELLRERHKLLHRVDWMMAEHDRRRHQEREAAEREHAEATAVLCLPTVAGSFVTRRSPSSRLR